MKHAHAELLAIQHIPQSLLNREAELMRAKWFDYRRLHPTIASYYLAHCYAKAFKEVNKLMKGDEVGQYQQPFQKMNFLELDKEKLSFWRLRQLIDSLGMRYDFFLREMMKWYTGNGWTSPPRPCHLLNNAQAITDTMVAWEEECRARLQIAKDPYFKAKNWVGGVDQIAWENFLITQIKHRRHPQYALGAALYIDDALRIEKALECFEARVLYEAIADYAPKISHA